MPCGIGVPFRPQTVRVELSSRCYNRLLARHLLFSSGAGCGGGRRDSEGAGDSLYVRRGWGSIGSLYPEVRSLLTPVLADSLFLLTHCSC